MKPEFLVDRSLGRYDVPNAVRAKGYAVHTLWDVYGRREQRLGDHTWAEDASRKGWVILTGDPNICRAIGERGLRELKARIFTLPRNHYSGREQVRRFTLLLPKIVKVCNTEKPPFMYGVYASEVKRLWPK